MAEGEGQVASHHADPEELLRKIEDTGKQILDHYCKVDEPTMLPPAPNTSKFIDKFPEEDLSEQNEGDLRTQEGYEAEVKIYRALESLKKDIIVLHGLEYTNLQYSLFVRDHVYKKPGDTLGECDFVVIGKNFVVIIEVADVRVEATNKRIRDTFKEKKRQGERTEMLVRGVLGHINSASDSIFIRWFCAFPSMERDALVNRRNFDEEKLARIVFKDELEKSLYNTNASNEELGIPNCFQRFGSWWKLNVIDKITSKHGLSSEAFDHLKKVLLGLWSPSMDSQNTCNPEQVCSLGSSILKTDKQLNNAEITFGFGRKKPGFENPSIVEADDVFKKLGIKFLTKEQNEVFISDQKFLLINGPAGSGKTVLLLGKIVQLVQSESDKKVVLFTFGKDKGRVYKNKLKKAGIVCETSMFKGPDFSSVREKMARLKQSGRLQVMIIENTISITTSADADLFNELVTMATGCHVFVDDGQCLHEQYHLGKFNVYEHHGNNVLYNVSHILRRMSSDNTTVWILCDLIQTVDVPYWPREPQPLLTQVLEVAEDLENTVPPEQLATLSTNLRNTRDISDVSSNIRSVLMRMENPEYSLNKRIVPEHAPGHFIHGPKLVVNVLPSYSSGRGTWEEYKLLDKMLNREIDKIYNPEGALQNTDIAILIGRSSSFLWTTAGERIKNINNVPVCHLEDCHSEEWPAVIVIAELNHSIRTDQSFAKLYFAISRARTYCSIIIPRTKDNCEDCINYFCKMFVGRVEYRKIIPPPCHRLLY